MAEQETILDGEGKPVSPRILEIQSRFSALGRYNLNIGGDYCSENPQVELQPLDENLEVYLEIDEDGTLVFDLFDLVDPILLNQAECLELNKYCRDNGFPLRYKFHPGDKQELERLRDGLVEMLNDVEQQGGNRR